MAQPPTHDDLWISLGRHLPPRIALLAGLRNSLLTRRPWNRGSGGDPPRKTGLPWGAICCHGVPVPVMNRGQQFASSRREFKGAPVTLALSCRKMRETLCLHPSLLFSIPSSQNNQPWLRSTSSHVLQENGLETQQSCDAWR